MLSDLLYLTKIALIKLILILALCNNIFGGDNPLQHKNGNLYEVVVIGIGKDSDSALRNAFRAALEEVLGVLVDSETLVNNDDVISDNILSYSGGYVEKHEIIKGPDIKDGLVIVEIKALVAESQLMGKLKSYDIQIKSIDGQSLFGEVVSKIDQHKSSINITKDIFKGFPENIIEAYAVGKPEMSKNNTTLSLNIQAKINYDKYQLMATKIKQTLDRIANKIDYVQQGNELNFNRFNELIYKKYTSRPFAGTTDDGHTHTPSYFVIGEKSNAGNKFTIYFLDKDIVKSLVSSIRMPRIKVDVTDKNGRVILTHTTDKEFRCFGFWNRSHRGLGMNNRGSFNESYLFVCPWVYVKNGNHWNPYEYYSGIFSWDNIPIEYLKKLENIKVKVISSENTIDLNY